MAKIPEKGLIYKTSRISYITNYFIIALIIIFLILLWQKFSLPLIPRSSEEMFPFLVLLAFSALVAYLVEEAGLERLVRQYIVTNNEVIKIEGVLRKKRTAIPYQSVADIGVEKGVLGRIFNFGNVVISGFKDRITMRGLKNPDEVYRIIQNKISKTKGVPRAQKTEQE
ncbi:MAG: PH domain-containing protein [Candidatus Heimdallarchaeota archaeon]